MGGIQPPMKYSVYGYYQRRTMQVYSKALRNNKRGSIYRLENLQGNYYERFILMHVHEMET
jgi:hypothetical protein